MTTNEKLKYAVVIPTCGKPHVERKFLRLLKNSEQDTIFIFSINPVDIDEAEIVFEKMEAIQDYAERYFGKTYNVVKLWEDHSTSFGDACNKGYEYVRENCGEVETVIFLNDDVDVTYGWQRKLLKTLNSEKYFTNTSLVQQKPGRDINKIPFKIGFAGPQSNNVGSSQRLNVSKWTNSSEPRGALTDHISAEVQSRSVSIDGHSKNMVTLFLSGFCLACNPQLLKELYEEDGFIFDPIFKIGGYEDNDLAVRGLNKGWISLIDLSTYVGHDGSQTLDSSFVENRRGMTNFATYLDKWKGHTQREQKIVGAYRVAILNINNLAQMGSSVRINHEKVDSLAILLTNNPAEAFESYDKPLFDRLSYHDQQFLTDCKAISDETELANRFKEWLQMYVPPDYELNVECWELSKQMNEREERNYNYEMATSMGAEWIVSIDSDECFEDRMNSNDLRKLTKNPDPLISLYTFGWLNHYESMDVIRTDPPFCNGFLHGMNGARMWKVWNNSHFPIIAGNDIGFHCGNAPEYGPYVLKGTNFRFRHLSMVREIDRVAKTSFYNSHDQDKDPAMIGNSDYSHISRSENVSITMYKRNNGIGFFNLAYDQEDMILLADKIRNYALCADDYLIIWTSEWKEEDKGWLEIPVAEFPPEEKWREAYPTGPDHFIAVVSRLYGVKYKTHPISDGLAKCRNQALKHFYADPDKSRIGWALYLDPDEMAEGHSASIVACFRRMAESTDSTAFTFKFKNMSMLKNGKQHVSNSESMRLIRLDLRAPVFFYGKAHETLEKSLNLLSKQGVNIIVNPCPLSFINTGLHLPPEQIASKLEKYQGLLIDSLKEDPYSSAAWVSAGMSYEQDGDAKNAELCYERSCLVAGTAFLPFQSLGLFYARRAVGLFYAASERTRQSPPLHKQLTELFSGMRQLVGDFPIIDAGEAKPSSKFNLPPFPYNEMVYDEGNNQIVALPEKDNGDSDKGL